MGNIFDILLYDAHVVGECDSDCEYCHMEDKVNEEYAEYDSKSEKSALVGKNSKALKKF